MDELDSEHLSFPTTHCGQSQADNNERLMPVHYTMCKWELRRKESCAVSTKHFLKIKKIANQANSSKLINLVEGFRVLRNLRGSPPHF